MAINMCNLPNMFSVSISIRYIWQLLDIYDLYYMSKSSISTVSNMKQVFTIVNTNITPHVQHSPGKDLKEEKNWWSKQILVNCLQCWISFDLLSPHKDLPWRAPLLLRQPPHHPHALRVPPHYSGLSYHLNNIHPCNPKSILSHHIGLSYHLNNILHHHPPMSP